jgi:hypothetical protein
MDFMLVAFASLSLPPFTWIPQLSTASTNPHLLHHPPHYQTLNCRHRLARFRDTFAFPHLSSLQALLRQSHHLVSSISLDCFQLQLSHYSPLARSSFFLMYYKIISFFK